MKRLYIDDERNPRTDYNWCVVRTYDDAIDYILTYGLPEYISFDHDLGTPKTGYDIASEIIRLDMDKLIDIPSTFTYNVHSANVCGAKNIQGILDSYMRFKHG